MDEIKFRVNEDGVGAFYIMNSSRQLGEMVVKLFGEKLTVHHTEVVPEAEGNGLAKKMLDAMVTYARKNKLKVIALCPYVHAQFRRHEPDYADVWQREQKP